MHDRNLGEKHSDRPENGPARRRWPLAILDPDPLTAMPRVWRGAAQAATIGIFIILFLGALAAARPIVVPVAAAFVVTMMLGPLSQRADRYGVPTPVTAIVLWLVVAAVFHGLIMVLSAPVVDWISKAPDITRSIHDKLAVLERPLAALRTLRNAVLPSQAGQGLNVDIVAIAQKAVAVATPAIGQIVIFFVALFFMLLGWRRVRHVLVGFFHAPDARLRALKVINDVEHNLTGYLSVVAVINVGVGIGAGLLAWAVALPDALAWGVLGFILNFIPYIGALIMELAMFMVGLVTFSSLTHALIAPLAFLALAIVEGQFITPSILGRHFTLNPLTVFLSLVFWTWLWGPLGAFLSMPILIMALVAFAHLLPKHEPALPD
jgi:predicted PurR-regulated permease PerM